MKFRIRSKLAAALAIPLLALVAGATFAAVEARADADRLDDQTDTAREALTNRSLVEALQTERAAVALDLVDAEGPSAEEAIAAVDAAVADLAATTPIDGAPMEPVLAAVAELDAVRESYSSASGASATPDGGRAMADALAGRYDAVIDEVLAWTGGVAADLDVASLRNGIEIVDAAQRRDEARARAVLREALPGETSTTIAAGEVRAQVYQDRLDQLAVGAYQLDTAAPTDEVVEGTIEILAAESADLGADAQARMRWFVIAAAAAVSLAILVTYAATTSITRPLRLLRREAEEMASARLPRAVLSILETPEGEEIELPEIAPVRVTSRDEVAEVASALNEVQTRALALAADQAVLRRNFSDSFVNLGRRNQLLVDRQLDFITELEEHETDPDQLDSLFQLDHLATRMRRNAESLLVLAGAASPRQWSAPVGVSEVVRSGLGEVEHYQRVSIRHLDDAQVVGTAAAGVAHVVAELAENALSFSPPEEVVEVKGRWSGAEYVIAIVDNGIGMGTEDLERANRRLSGQESYTVAPSRYLGHYVAGNLAEQLGIGVRLHSDPAGGIVATITLPQAVLAGATVDEQPVGPPAALPTPPAAGAEIPDPDPAPFREPDPVADVGPPPAPAAPVADVGPPPAPAAPVAAAPTADTSTERAPEAFDHDDLRSWLADSLPRPRIERIEPAADPVPAPEPAPEQEPDPVAEVDPPPAPADPTAPARIDWMAVDSWDAGDPARSEDDRDWMKDLPPRVADRSDWAVGAIDGLRAAAEELRAPTTPGAGETEPSVPSALPTRVPGAQRPGQQPTIDRSGADRSVVASDETTDPARSAAGALGFLEAFSGPTPSLPDAGTPDTGTPETEEQR